ncbi:MAG TPA: ferritin-like domain-containing protein [Solirubrobacteraceae bacterium]
MIDGLNLEHIDVDGAIREGADAVAGDTRMSFLRKGAIAGGTALSGGAMLGAIAAPALAAGSRPPASFGAGDVGILQFALTLEYLEAAFYNEATAHGAVKSAQLRTFLRTVTKDENAHVAFLRKGLTAAGVKPVAKPKFNFHGTTRNEAKFAATALALENTGVHAYLGQAGNLQTPKYLLAAASIVTIEARHAGVIGLILGKAIAPSGPFDTGLPASAILKAVKKTKFIVG